MAGLVFTSPVHCPGCSPVRMPKVSHTKEYIQQLKNINSLDLAPSKQYWKGKVAEWEAAEAEKEEQDKKAVEDMKKLATRLKRKKETLKLRVDRLNLAGLACPEKDKPEKTQDVKKDISTSASEPKGAQQL